MSDAGLQSSRVDEATDKLVAGIKFFMQKAVNTWSGDNRVLTVVFGRPQLEAILENWYSGTAQ